MKRLTLLFAVGILIISACSKEAKDFSGTWKLSTAPITGFRYYWILEAVDDESGSVAIITEDTLSLVIDTCATGEFTVKNKILTIGAPVNFCEWSTYDGEWDVHELKDNRLILIRYLPRGTIYLEFLKK